MASPDRPPVHHHRDLAVLLALLIVLLFASPLADWWAVAGAPWYLPYLLWGAVIALAGLAAARRRPDEP